MTDIKRKAKWQNEHDPDEMLLNLLLKKLTLEKCFIFSKRLLTPSRILLDKKGKAISS